MKQTTGVTKFFSTDSGDIFAVDTPYASRIFEMVKGKPFPNPVLNHTMTEKEGSALPACTD
jgi:hypothetical protein